jgi:hypothetical protein
LGLCAIVVDADTYERFRPDERGIAVFFFAGTTDGARAMLSMVSGAAISAVTLTFSLTVLSLQLAASNYSPRILDEFINVFFFFSCERSGAESDAEHVPRVVCVLLCCHDERLQRYRHP